MAYNITEIFERSKKLIVDKKLIFVEDIVCFLGIAKSTFYLYFPDGSDELDILRTLLNENRIAIKSSLRKKWFDSDNATLQMALYKLTSSPEEHKLLQQNYTDVTTNSETIQRQPIVFIKKE